jgi:hypothetical protein
MICSNQPCMHTEEEEEEKEKEKDVRLNVHSP